MSRSPLIKIFAVLSACLFEPAIYAQELNCTVEFNTQQLQNVSTSVFQSLQEAVNDYMNTTKFSEAQIGTNEKIECRMFFTISEYNDGIAKGSLQVQAIRPVYNTSYTTTLVNFKDNRIDFSYFEGEPLIFSENTMENQLTAILNFYAYLIIALDRDSFAPKGGEEAFDRLKMIVQMAQS